MTMMYLRMAAIVASLTCASSSLLSQPVVPTNTKWPARYAVAMRQGDQLPPFTLEATDDGWVWLTFLSTRPDMGLGLPSARLIVEASDVRRWTASIRTALRSTKPPRFPASPPLLGRGGYKLAVTLPYDTADRRINVSQYACDPGSMGQSPTPAEVFELLDLLDSAAVVAGSGSPQSPTLARAYYASEVSCPAQLKNGSARPHFDDSGAMPDVGAQFVVDATGAVEARSIRFLPGTPRFAAEAARAAIAQWRFRPAERDGTPLRQVVQMPVSFAAERKRATPGSHEITVSANDDGWVHFTHDDGSEALVSQAWFHPDSVDAWAARVARMNSVAAAAMDSRADTTVDRVISLGSRIGIRYSASFYRQGTTIGMSAGLTACRGASIESEKTITDLTPFTTAARMARANGLPRMSSRPYETNEVECPAWLMWTRAQRPGFTRVWRYPTGAYPPAMGASNARADVLVSVVVDTTGHADLRTLQVIADSDPRAAAAVATSFESLRFEPATRAGHRVRQRVIQVIRFEPSPICVAADAGPACARRYSDR